jgi:predicted transcriptional regulator
MQDRSPLPHGVASQVDSLLRKFSALDYFRDRVREAAQEHIEAMSKCERREKLRREAAAKECVWSVSVDSAVAKKKLEEGCFHFPQTFQGRIKLPPGINKPLMGLTARAEFANRPIEPRCLRDRIPRGEWSKKDKREIEEFNKKLKDWEEEKAAYVTGPKKKGKWQKGPSKLELDWRPIFELAKERGFPDDGEAGLEYSFVIDAVLPDDLSEDDDPATDGPLPVSEKEEDTSLNFKYAGLAAIYDAHWAGSERVAPWGVVVRDRKVGPASGLPGEWQTSGEPSSYRAANWYWRLVISAKEVDDGNTTIVASWLKDVEGDLEENAVSRDVLTPEEKAILEVLAKDSHVAMTQESLETPTRLSVRTVRKYVSELRERGLVDQPRGRKKGFAITSAGLKAVGRE